ncbi:hypothetical protein D9757_004620 [Collybiopsis confluens]|uniref:SURF1-like protein n=1 Tax=Collybiopsis confluens TaxID=2823264 RepID=A0A8H5HSK9_9AGAR|nr:hypothetical protein D9757_004620 [Collybiopsis confluens]
MVVLGIIPVFTFVLGTWQVQRLKWKVNLIDELEEKLQLAPLSLPRKINLLVIPEFVFRKVLIHGKWDHEHTMLLTPRVREGVHGAHVITPLVRENGTTVLVDRGFVSNGFAENMSFTKEEGEVEVLGMLRTSQVRNRFTPDNLPDERKWYWNDVEGMAAYAGGNEANVQPVFVERIFGCDVDEDVRRTLRAQQRANSRKPTLGSSPRSYSSFVSPSANMNFDMFPNPESVKVPSSAFYESAGKAVAQENERIRLHSFRFPRIKDSLSLPYLQKRKRNSPTSSHSAISDGRQIPSVDKAFSSGGAMYNPKHIAPLPRFDPFSRPRADSMSSLLEPRMPADAAHPHLHRNTVSTSRQSLKRVATVHDVFDRIHRQAASMGVKVAVSG